jgi:hypothetical protein
VWIVDDEIRIANFTPSLVAASKINKKKKKNKSPAFKGKSGPLSNGFKRNTRSRTEAKLARYKDEETTVGKGSIDDNKSNNENNDGLQENLTYPKPF